MPDVGRLVPLRSGPPGTRPFASSRWIPKVPVRQEPGGPGSPLYGNAPVERESDSGSVAEAARKVLMAGVRIRRSALPGVNPVWPGDRS